MGQLRLDKYLADMKCGTRSQVKEFIRRNRVCVDETVISDPAFKVDPEIHIVKLDGNPVNYVETVYYMLNKPAGVLSATSDSRQKTVLDLVDAPRRDLFPVGRLDRDTEGLLLITNDGLLAHNLLAPGKHVDKTYYAKVTGQIGSNAVQAFAAGLIVDEKLTALPAKLEIIGQKNTPDDKDPVTAVYVTVQEGKFHQIKRMFAALGSEVRYLKRISMGPLSLDEQLALGAYRPLTAAEIALLRKASGKPL